MRAPSVLSAVALASSAPLHGSAATPTARSLSSVASAFVPIARSCLYGRRRSAAPTGRGAAYPLLSSCYSLRRPSQIPRRMIKNPFSSNSRSYGTVDGIRRTPMRLMPLITAGYFSQRSRRQQEQLRLLSMSAATWVTGGGGGSGRIRRKRGVRTAPATRLPASSTITNEDILREFASAAATEVGSMNDSSPSDIARIGERRGTDAEFGKEAAMTDEARPTGYRYGDVLADEDGLPLVYDSDVIGQYWDKRPRELSSRWTRFLSVTVPFVTRLIRDYTAGNIMKNEGELARDFRIVIEKLGPTFIKLGQALSIRPDVIGPVATDELAKLQDAVPPFPSPLAFEVLEEELGRPPSEVFSELTEEPVASASLSQVYRGVLHADGRAVAVKIQRPGLVQEVTKDLYVLKRAVAVYQNLSNRWTAQMTDYNELLRVWATGFYQELDFLNEANNQKRMQRVLSGLEGQVFVPDVVLELSTRRVLVSEWVDGIKLTKAEPAEIREVTSIAQEAFLVQLLTEGFMHSDPHPGNILLIDEDKREERGRLALLDFGLMAEIGVKEREGMVSALIHTANRDYKSLIEDLIALEVLPADTDRSQVEPVMKRVIGPYVFEGGGAKSLNYQSLARDLGRATLEIPFNIPPYFALIARALGILEGVALTGDPDYRIVMEAYPFVTRKIISDDSPALQRALRDILYTEDGKFLARRLSVLLSYATGVVAADSAVFVDFDTLPSTGASLSQTLDFVLGEGARPLRAALVGEASNAADLILRRATRQAVASARDLFRPPPPPLPFLPRLPSPPLFPIPDSVIDALSPRLTPEEDVFLASLEELVSALSGLEQGTISEDPLRVLGELLRPDNAGVAELADFAQTLPRDSRKTGALLEVGSEVVQNLVDKASQRLNGLLSVAATERYKDTTDHGTDITPWGGK